MLYFAAAREIVGISDEYLVFPTAFQTPSDLLRFLVDCRPELAPIRDSVLVAVNEEYMAPGIPLNLRDHDELAIIPPIGGG